MFRWQFEKRGKFSMGMKLIPWSSKYCHICIKYLDICNTNYNYMVNNRLSKLFLAEFRRGTAVSFLKTPGEVGRIVKTNLITYIGNAGIA